MKRRKLLTILLALVLGLSLCFTACGDNEDDPTGNGGKTPPTQQQWADAGISGTFNAEVKGTLALSNVSENGEITMKWTDSDEASFDNTIAWLKGQGYSSYGGVNAQKTTEEGGKLITYTAEKTVNGTATASANSTVDGGYSVISLSFTLTASSSESKTMIAETFYITEDFSIMGVSFKAGELYLDISEAQGAAVTPNSTTWPADKIEGVVGAGVPAYSGSATEYTFTSSSMGHIKTVQVMAVNGNYTEISAYQTLLTQNGFVASDDGYTKTLSNGDVLSVMAAESQGYDWSTGQVTSGILITITLEKNSGSYTSWSSLNLSEFSEAGIPAYSGGTSFDLDDAADDGLISTAEYEQIIAALEMAEQMGVLNAEDKAELDEAREKLALAQQVKAKVVIVYGTNEDQADAYETALTNAGFANGIKKTTEYQYEVDISEDEGKAVITISRLPIELAEDEDNGGSAATQTLGYTMPTNVKIVYDDGIYQYVIYKICDDYYVGKQYLPGSEMAAYSSGMIEQTYYKKNGSVWDIYTKGLTDTAWVKDTDWQEDDRRYLEREVFNFIVEIDQVEDAVKNGTQTVAGKICTVYELDTGYYQMVYYVDEESNLIFRSELYYSSTLASTYEITVFDTTVTSFADIELPQ